MFWYIVGRLAEVRNARPGRSPPPSPHPPPTPSFAGPRTIPWYFFSGGDPEWYLFLGAHPRGERSPPNTKYQFGSPPRKSTTETQTMATPYRANMKNAFVYEVCRDLQRGPSKHIQTHPMPCFRGTFFWEANRIWYFLLGCDRPMRRVSRVAPQ